MESPTTPAEKDSRREFLIQLATATAVSTMTATAKETSGPRLLVAGRTEAIAGDAGRVRFQVESVLDHEVLVIES
jgi:hypothetical protein